MTNLETMALESLKKAADKNPSRFIFIGMADDGSLYHITAIMGRSENSQNRKYVGTDDNKVRTEPMDPSKVKNPELIIYTAMDNCGDVHILGNGDQVETVRREIMAHSNPGEGFSHALGKRHAEPDYPIFTPRITGFSEVGSSIAYFSILYASPDAVHAWNEAAKEPEMESYKRFAATEPDGMAKWEAEMIKLVGFDPKQVPTQHAEFSVKLVPGLGYGLSTYQPGSPEELKPYHGPPFLFPIDGLLKKTMHLVWENLDERFRVGVAGKRIKPDGEFYISPPINKHER